jgi:serine/threonine-protein kinase RsbW
LKEKFFIEFSAVIDFVRVIRSALRSFLKLKNVSAAQVFDIELALSEAIVNIIKHTYKFQPEQKIQLTLTWDDREQSCSFVLEDFGASVPPERILSRDLEDVKDHGLGVYIIKSMMDEVSYSPKEEGIGNRLSMKKYLPVEIKK